jgi:superfamily II DNA/RNA helicase
LTQQDFRALGASEAVCGALEARGIRHPFQIQSLVIPEALRGGDVLAKSPTGSGKTLAFAIPIVQRVDLASPTPAALVLVPTRELAAQVTEEFELIAPKGLRVAAVYGGVKMKGQIAQAKGAHVIVATPGRLQDLVDRRVVSLANVRVLVLDEADRMLDMGFKPQVDRLMRDLPRERQTMFFSATLDGEVGELARRYTQFPARFEAELPAHLRVGEVEHLFVPVTADAKVSTLVDLLNEEDRGLALVFVRTKAGADRLVEKLRRHDVDAVAIHGDKGQAQRERALARFDAGRVKTLVATDVAARGLDVDDITHVINFDPPEEADVYTHRVGRTGRAGRGGTGITLVLPEQQGDVSRVARLQGHAESFEQSGMKMARPKLVYSSRRGRRSKW